MERIMELRVQGEVQPRISEQEVVVGGSELSLQPLGWEALEA